MSLGELIATGEAAIASINDFKTALPTIEKVVAAAKANQPISLTAEEGAQLETVANDVIKIGNELVSAVETAKTGG